LLLKSERASELFDDVQLWFVSDNAMGGGIQ